MNPVIMSATPISIQLSRSQKNRNMAQPTTMHITAHFGMPRTPNSVSACRAKPKIASFPSVVVTRNAPWGEVMP